MNERHMPKFNTESIKKRLCQFENLLGRSLTRNALDIDLAAQVIMAFASECERFNQVTEVNPQSFK
jgi:hypothetical protein